LISHHSRRSHDCDLQVAALDICKAVNDRIAASRAAPRPMGMARLNRSTDHIAEAHAASRSEVQGLLICSSWHGRFLDGEIRCVLGMGAGPPGAVFIIRRASIGHEQPMNQFKLDELIAGRSTPR